MKKYLDFVDYLLEEIFIMGYQSQIDRKQKLVLISILEYHINNCQIPDCLIQRGGELEDYINSKNKKIDQKKIINIINILFRQFIDQINKDTKIKLDKQGLKEHLSLKYYCFLFNKQDNPVNAYYQLKNLLISSNNQKFIKNCSLLFIVLNKLISESIQNQIEKKFQKSHRQQ